MSKLTESDFAELDTILGDKIDISVDKLARRKDDAARPVWNEDKRLPIALILGLLGNLIFAVWSTASFKAETDGKFLLIDARIQTNAANAVVDADALKDAITAWRSQYERLNDKMDRILERANRK
jgi:hypothetical protein